MSAKKQTNLFKFFGTPNSAKKLEPKTTPKTNDTPKSAKAGRKRIINDSDNDSGSDNECIQATKKSRIKTISSSSDEDGSNIPSTRISTPKLSTPKHQKPITPRTPFLSTPTSSKKSLGQFGQKNSTNNKENLNDEVLSLRTECIKSNKLPHQIVADKNNELDNKVMDIGMDSDLTPGNHQNLPFLQPDAVCDKNRRRPFIDPDYDPKSLYVPPDFLKQQTPCMKQWWQIKSDHFDCILFFKVGKFYELYHMDAVVGVKKLGLTYMKGNYAHCGFPEPSYGRMAGTLVEMGYKVARVEQTETPEMLAERNTQNTVKNKGKEKVVRREVCQVTTKGTKVFGVHDIESSNFEASYLLAIIETNDLTKRNCIETSVCKYGVCIVETSLGVFHIGQFEDDLHRSNLLLMLTHYPPGLILYPRNGISDRTLNIFKTMVPATVHRERLIPNKQFLTTSDTINFLLENQYFNDSSSSNNQWPGVLKDFFQGDSIYNTFVPDDAKLAVQAFGATCWYLNYSKLDAQILSMKNFKHFKLPVSDADDDTEEIYNSNMIIDAITMHHLRILDNNNGLVKKLNLCKTAFGKRLLRSWITQPLCCVDTIQERLNAVETILNCGTNFIKSIQKQLQKLPDLERLITRITGLGNKKHAKHPDSRAVFFDKSYSKTKIIDFCKLIDGFTMIVNEINSAILAEVNDSDALLKRLTTLASDSSDGEYPDYRKDIQKIRRMFDCKHAMSEGVMIPPARLDEDYDQILIHIKDLEDDLEEYRIEQCKLLKCQITYFGNDKKRFQLSVPVPKTKSNVHVPDEYQLESATKTVKRYSTARTKQLLAAMIAAEEKKGKIIQKYTRRIFEEFSKSNEKWLQALKCISYIDVLFSFAAFSNADNMCKPVIRKPNKNENPFINIIGGRHACIAKEDFIPNDISIGTNDIASLILLTGPNMGGKSTIMRTCALITIIGQLGCYVPATECEFTIVDRIFTRIGARDNIELGHSTFYVELEETYSILKYASRYSLALLDELGRGTSTFDGMCIADGVIWYLAQCRLRTIASTHYHQLIDKYIEDNTYKNIITLQHMACFVDIEGAYKCQKYGKIVDRIVYLYKLTLGACPKSFGFNVAHSAQLPTSIIKRGRQMADLFESEARLIREFDKLIQF